MGGEWKSIRFGELYEYPSRNGLMKPKRVRGEGFKFINMGEIFAHDRMLNIPCDRVPLTDKEEKSSLVEAGDLLFARQSLTLDGAGKCSIFLGDDEPVSYESHLIRVRLDRSRVDPRFLYYFFKSPNGKAEMWTIVEQGAGQAGIRGSDLENLNIPLPDYDCQNKVALIFSSIDDKIQLNRQINETLEKMAQALFKSWFVDFDPVIDNALAAGNTIPDELQDRAERRQQQLAKPDHQPLPDAIRQLFPSEFELTEELGWVPMGWEIMSISDLAQVIKGKSYKSSELEESKTALVTLKSFMRGGGYRLDGLKEYTGKYKPEQEVFAGDLVIAYTDVTQAADVIGKPAMVISDTRYEHLVISLDVAVVRPEKNNYKYFLYGLAQTEKFQEHTHSHSTGTTVLHLGKSAVPEYSFAKPSDETLGVYINIVKPKYRSIDANIQNSRALEKLRDTLLPKLISGELRLPLDALSDSAQQLADATSSQ